jgi:Cas7 group CRISPR-associated protein Csh2
MLDTLIQIGTLARVGQSEWDALIFKPQTDVKTDQTAAKTDQYLIYFLEFDLDALTMRPEVKATYNEERVNLYRNLQVKGGNNSAYYTTVHTPKHFEQLSKTLFGKKPKIGEKIPTKGEFLDLIEKENPALRETMLAKALEKIFELKELFQTTFAEGDKSAALKVSATEKMHLLVAAVKWAAEGIEVCYQSSIPSGLKIHFYRFNFLIIKKYPNMSMILKNNSDFLFLYEAIQCNPNGDPDQENRPRMDTDTETNLVTDTRIKRYIRDFLKMQGIEIFVDMEGTTKVSSDRKLEVVIKRLLENEAGLSNILTPEFMTKWADIKKESKAKDVPTIIKFMKDKKNKALCSDLNLFLLAYIVKQQFIDIRLFGSAFAIEGFNQSYIGPVQLNWGYSLHKVKLMESNSIVK